LEKPRNQKMKNLIKVTAISILFFLASCKSVVVPPVVSPKAPDVLSKPTQTSIVQETNGELEANSIVSTPATVNTNVTLAQETVAKLKENGDVSLDHEIILPKNTEIVLPEKTPVQIIQPTPVVIPAQTDVILPNGTEITIRKINWYALLFYCTIIFGAAFWYIKSKNKDCNQDGYEDLPKKINKNKRK
jgi:hypothetical protein